MTVTVLVVDDSTFFRRRIVEILRSIGEVDVVGVASNGQEAIEKNLALSPDVITMDYEMPLMDGVTAIRHIMRDKPTAILMFSSLTFEGARVTLDALAAGALDYLPKSFESIAPRSVDIGRVLTDRILAVVNKHDRKENLERSSDNLYRDRAYLDDHAKDCSKQRNKESAKGIQSTDTASSTSALTSRPSWQPRVSEPLARKPVVREPLAKPVEERGSSRTFSSSGSSRSVASNGPMPSLLLIGASTGGPIALQTVLTALPANFPVPILVVQHMPKAFTQAFADRLNQFCPLQVKEAQDNDLLIPGEVLVAPGGKQMLVAGSSSLSVRILESDERLQYKPSVDVTFGSAAKAIPGKILALVLTGMGADGREGAKLLKRGNSRIWTQDEASCVVYGMPLAVKNARLSDEEVRIADMGRRLVAEFRCGST